MGKINSISKWAQLLQGPNISPSWHSLVWQSVQIQEKKAFCQVEYSLPQKMTAEEEAALAAFLLPFFPQGTQIQLNYRKPALSLDDFQAAQDEKILHAITVLEKSRDAGCFVGPIYGKAINGDLLPFHKLDDNIDGIFHACGEIIECSESCTKNGKYSLNITLAADGLVLTGRLALKQEAEKEEILPLLKTGQWLRFRGRFFQAAKGKMLLLYAIHGVNPPLKRMDKEEEKRTEFCVFTKESELTSIVGIEEIMRLAACFGHKAIAITDKNSLRALPQALREAEKRGLQLIAGFYTHLLRDKRYPIILLAKNQKGVLALNALLTIAYENDAIHPFLREAQFVPYRDSILLGAANDGEPESVIKEKRKVWHNCYDYWQILPDKDPQVMQQLLVLAKEKKVPLIVSNEVCYIHPTDMEAWQLLGAGMQKIPAPELHYFATTKEILQKLYYLDEDTALDLTVKNGQKLLTQISAITMPQTESVVAGGDFLSYQQKAQSIWGDCFEEELEVCLQKEWQSLRETGLLGIFEAFAKVKQIHKLSFTLDHEYGLIPYLLGLQSFDPTRFYLQPQKQKNSRSVVVVLPEEKRECFLSFLCDVLEQAVIIPACAQKLLGPAAAQSLAQAYFAQEGKNIDEKKIAWLRYRSQAVSLGLDAAHLTWFVFPSAEGEKLPKQKLTDGRLTCHDTTEYLAQYYPHFTFFWNEDLAFLQKLVERNGWNENYTTESILHYYEEKDTAFYYCEVLNLLSDKKQVELILQKIQQKNIAMLAADINQSQYGKYLVIENGILPPLEDLPAVDAIWAQKIAEARENGPFYSQEELIMRIQPPAEILSMWQTQSWYQSLAADSQLSIFDV